MHLSMHPALWSYIVCSDSMCRLLMHKHALIL
nr:MAG TPA: hypothetical protein [Caudoviricetes sp.]